MKDKLDKLFEDSKNQFDIEEPTVGHFGRFEAKLSKSNKSIVFKPITWRWLAVAASIILFFGIWVGTNLNNNENFQLADVSPQMHETETYFINAIEREIELINSKKNVDNKKLIDDSFNQLKKLEDQYQKLTLELSENNEDKRIIFAMISNYQQRISVLENLLNELNRVEELKTINYENLV